MSTYPGEDPQTPQGQPADQDASQAPIEPTQPVGYWERQAAEQGQPGQVDQNPYYDQGPYGQAPDATPYGGYASGSPQQYGASPYAAPGSDQAGWYPPSAGQPVYPPQPGGFSFGAGYSPAQREHPQATLSMVLGLVGLIGGLLVCGLPLLVSPVAWVIGRNALKDIEASQGRLGGDGLARSGMIMGIVGTVLLILAILVVLAVIVLLIADSSTGTTTGSTV